VDFQAVYAVGFIVANNGRYAGRDDLSRFVFLKWRNTMSRRYPRVSLRGRELAHTKEAWRMGGCS
jgi:hypothetical protein